MRTLRTLSFAGAIFVFAVSPETSLGSVFDQFQQLCLKNAGNRITRVVPTVDGFLWLGQKNATGVRNLGCREHCVYALFEAGYRFVESEAPGTNDPTGAELRAGYVERWPSITEEPGLYRFTLQQRGHQDCKLFEQHTRGLLLVNWHRQSRTWFPDRPGPVQMAVFSKRMEQSCIASGRAGKMKARHSYGESEELIHDKRPTIHHRSKVVKDLATDSAIAEYNQYIFFANAGRDESCGSHPRDFLLWEILIPASAK